jgi:hypothetical protein
MVELISVWNFRFDRQMSTGQWLAKDKPQRESGLAVDTEGPPDCRTLLVRGTRPHACILVEVE